MDNGVFPHILKDAFIIPQLKPGRKKENPASWRPIAITSQISKVFEKLVKIHLMNHLENNNNLGSFQYGFRKKKSCLSQMLLYYEEITQNLEDGVNTDNIFLDMEKAFDKVDQGLLAHRIKEKQIIGKWGCG